MECADCVLRKKLVFREFEMRGTIWCPRFQKEIPKNQGAKAN